LRLTRFILLLATGAVVAVVAAGCGNDVPSGAVAKVDDTVIKQEEFDHWLQAAAQGQQPPGAGGAVVVPDPPDFTECVDAKKQQPVPPGSKKPTDDDLKKQCEQEFDSLKQQVMQFLISAEWIQQEADARDIEVSDEEVQKQFEDQKKQSFPNEKDYKQFLKTSGQTEEDLLFRVKLDVLSNKVREKVIEGKGNFGYNAATGVFEDLVKAGVIDPTKVTRTALQNAASVSTLLLTSDALIAEKPKDDKHGKKGGGGHGGDYDMY